MQGRTKHVVTGAVLVIYLFSGAMAFWGVLGHVFRSSSPVHVLAGSKKPASQPVRVVWTQQKHYPSFTQNDVPAPAVVFDRTFSHWRVSFILVDAQKFTQVSSSASARYSPRSPPFC